MAKCTGIIKERLSLHPIIDKLVEHRMINEYEKSQVLDDHSGLNTNQRMEKLLNFVKASIKEDGEEFGLFVDLIKQENTRRGDRLQKNYRTLMNNYYINNLLLQFRVTLHTDCAAVNGIVYSYNCQDYLLEHEKSVSDCYLLVQQKL